MLHGYKKLLAFVLALAALVAMDLTGHGSVEVVGGIVAVLASFVGGQAMHDRAKVAAPRAE